MVGLIAVGSGVLGALVPIEATGVLAVDVIYRWAFAAAVSYAAADARRWSHLVAAGLVLAGTGGQLPLAGVAGFALGASIGVADRRRPGRVFSAVVGALIAQVALRLTWPDLQWATAGLALVAASLLVGSGLRNMRAARRAWGRRIAVAVGGAGVVAVLMLALGAALLRDEVTEGLRAADSGLASAREGASEGTSKSFAQSAHRWGRAADQLNGPLFWPARLLPAVGRYVAAGRGLAAAASDLSAAATDAAQVASSDELRFKNGRVDPAAIAAVEEPLSSARAAIPPARLAVGRLGEEWLPARLAARVVDLEERLDKAEADAEVALQAAKVAPSLLAAGGERSYLLVVQSPAEQRGSGGIVGAFAEVKVADGRLSLVRVGRHRDLRVPGGTEPFGPADYQARYAGVGPWVYPVNASFSPDFPTVASVLRELYQRSNGRVVDGVISVDPVSLAALLELTGPVPVPGWPVPIGAANAERVLLHEQYVSLTADAAAREDFLAAALQTIFQRLLTSDLPGPPVIARHLAPVVGTDHLMLSVGDAAEQHVLDRLGVSGAVTDVERDYLQVVTHNATQSKIEWFQRRSVSYDVTFDPATGVVDAVATVRIDNDAPPGGLPPYVIGGGRGFLNDAAGVDRLWLNVYSPLRLVGATVDGRPAGFTTSDELGRLVHSSVVSVAPQSATVVELRLSGVVTAGAYRLAVDQQPTITPDRLSVQVTLTDPWLVSQVEPSVRSVRAGIATWEFSDGRDRKFGITAVDGAHRF